MGKTACGKETDGEGVSVVEQQTQWLENEDK